VKRHAAQPLSMTDAQAAYLAGLFDGEGCVNVYFRRHTKNGRRYARLMVRVSQNEPAVLRWAMALASMGNISANKPRRAHENPNHVWTVSCSSARRLLATIRPYLIVKAAAVDRALALDAEVVDCRPTSTSSSSVAAAIVVGTPGDAPALPSTDLAAAGPVAGASPGTSEHDDELLCVARARAVVARAEAGGRL